MQRSLREFLDRVEEKTKELELSQPKTLIKPKYSLQEEQETVKKMVKIWNSSYNLKIDEFLDIVLSVLERREEDYKKLISGMKKETLQIYNKLFSILLRYYTFDYNYGDILGNFYMQTYSKGDNGEYYTPYNVAYFIAKVLEPEPKDKVIDPCVGSGVMLLATRHVIHEKYGWIESSKFGRNLYGMDISDNAVKMTKIQLYLTDYIYMSMLLMETFWEMFKGKK